MKSSNFVETFQMCIIGYSVLSCIFSSYVILSFHKFRGLHVRVFTKYIYYISVADFFMGISSFSFPPGGSVLCWIQGMAIKKYISNFFKHFYMSRHSAALFYCLQLVMDSCSLIYNLLCDCRREIVV